MSIIKSITQTDYTTTVKTKFNDVKVYEFNTKKENKEFYKRFTYYTMYTK